MRILKHENGNVLVLTAMCLSILMGFMGLAADVGMLFHTQRQMQIAADAAAVAGALDYKYNSSASSAVTQGCAAATANGVTNTCTTGACSSSVTGAQVCMMVPPADGPNKGTTGFVEAIVQYPYPTLFMKVFNMKAITVSGRAVAGAVGAGTGCLITLARSGVDIAYSGSGSLDATNCDIYDNSNASNSIDLSGSGSITANAIGIALTGSDVNTGSGRISPKPVNGMAPIADPLVNLPAPTVSSPTAVSGSCVGSSCNYSCSGSSNCTIGPGTYTSITDSGSGTLTLTPGNYTITGNLSNSGGGITLQAGSGSNTINIGGTVSNSGSGAMNLGAGNYNIVGSVSANSSGAMTIGNGNVTIGGNLNITGAGALNLGTGNYNIGGNLESTGSGGTTIENGSSSANNYLVNTGGQLELTGSGGLSSANATFYTVGEVTITGSGSMSLVAPTTGTYNGVLVFQSRTAGSTASLTGSGSETVDGIFYAPNAAFTLSGSGSWNVSLDVIVDSVSDSGSGSINITDYAASVNNSSVLGANYGTTLTAKMVMVE